MRHLYLYLLVILSIGIIAIAGCKKENETITATPPATTPPPLPPPQEPAISKYCSDANAKTGDTTIAELQLKGPIEDWGYVWWEEMFSVPQITGNNSSCIRVFIAQKASDTFHEIPVFGNTKDYKGVNFRVIDPGTSKLYIRALTDQTQFPTVDFTKKVAVKIFYKTV